MDAEANIGPDSEPDVEATANPDAESGANAVTGLARPLDEAWSDASANDNGHQLTGAKPGVSPGLDRRKPTRHADVSDDDRDIGWGERPASSGRDDDWYLRERPPHHG